MLFGSLLAIAAAPLGLSPPPLLCLGGEVADSLICWLSLFSGSDSPLAATATADCTLTVLLSPDKKLVESQASAGSCQLHPRDRSDSSPLSGPVLLSSRDNNGGVQLSPSAGAICCSLALREAYSWGRDLLRGVRSISEYAVFDNSGVLGEWFLSPVGLLTGSLVCCGVCSPAACRSADAGALPAPSLQRPAAAAVEDAADMRPKNCEEPFC